MKKNVLKRNLKRAPGYLFRYVILTGLAFIILYPFFVKVVISFMTVNDLSDATVRFIPKYFTLENFGVAIERMGYYSSLAKTLLFCGSLSLVQVTFAMLTAYGLSRFHFPGAKLLFASVLLTLIVPPQAIVIPLYLRFHSFDIFGIVEALTGSPINLLGKPFPIYLLAATGLGLKNGLLIFIFRQFFLNFPNELEEAASIDGAGVFRTFRSIIVPSSIPMILTCFLFSFVWQWADDFYTSIFVPDNNFLVREIQILGSQMNLENEFAGVVQSSPYYTSLVTNAGGLLVVLPILLLFLICQRHFVESIERSGLVG